MKQKQMFIDVFYQVKIEYINSVIQLVIDFDNDTKVVKHLRRLRDKLRAEKKIKMEDSNV